MTTQLHQKHPWNVDILTSNDETKKVIAGENPKKKLQFISTNLCVGFDSCMLDALGVGTEGTVLYSPQCQKSQTFKNF